MDVSLCGARLLFHASWTSPACAVALGTDLDFSECFPSYLEAHWVPSNRAFEKFIPCEVKTRLFWYSVQWADQPHWIRREHCSYPSVRLLEHSDFSLMSGNGWRETWFGSKWPRKKHWGISIGDCLEVGAVTGGANTITIHHDSIEMLRQRPAGETRNTIKHWRNLPAKSWSEKSSARYVQQITFQLHSIN